jgi:hypothetical protein
MAYLRHKTRVRSPNGSIVASIWENTNDKGAFYDVTFERIYQDVDGAWQSSNNYKKADLQDLREAANLAYNWISSAKKLPAKLCGL